MSYTKVCDYKIINDSLHFLIFYTLSVGQKKTTEPKELVSFRSPVNHNHFKWMSWYTMLGRKIT